MHVGEVLVTFVHFILGPIYAKLRVFCAKIAHFGAKLRYFRLKMLILELFWTKIKRI